MAQTPSPHSGQTASADPVQALRLPTTAESELHAALARKDYRAAEAQLLQALNADPSAPESAQRLLLLGDVYFLAEDYLQAAAAWQKASRLKPLPEQVRFSLAMAYIRLRRPDWATAALTALHQQYPANALYPFWMGRIAYDAQQYSSAADAFRLAIQLDPAFVRAHDNLGLCLYDMNQVNAAIAEYRRAIQLQQGRADASPWPYLNLGIAEEFQGNLDGAAAAYREATKIDAGFDQPHYQLGNLLASQNQLAEATQELEKAVQLNPSYLQAHAALARVYRREGQLGKAQKEADICTLLRQKAAGAN